LHVFGALCYPKNDRKDIGKLGAKGDTGFFIGYSADSCAYRIYNRQIKKIMETINVSFDELSAMAFEQCSSKPGLQCELDLLFEAMYDDYFGGQPSAYVKNVPPAQEPQIYNRRTKKIMETMNVLFDELSTMAFEQSSSKPRLQSMTSGYISSGLDLTYASSTITTQQPSEGELDLLFEAMYDDYFGGQPSATVRIVPPAQEQ
nr:integrase, catalytic region, zinc finger, CCHC-type, peptidase aspartic, catalytic [Tanacetum cinerariifolium]